MSRSLAASPILENQKFKSNVFSLNQIKGKPDLRTKAMSPIDHNQSIFNNALPPLSSTPKPDASESSTGHIPKNPVKLKFKTNPLEIKNEILMREIKKLKHELANLKKYVD